MCTKPMLLLSRVEGGGTHRCDIHDVMLSYIKRDNTHANIQRQRPSQGLYLLYIDACDEGGGGRGQESLIGNNEQTALDLIYYSSTSISPSFSLFSHNNIYHPPAPLSAHQTSAKMHSYSLYPDGGSRVLLFVMFSRFPYITHLA